MIELIYRRAGFYSLASGQPARIYSPPQFARKPTSRAKPRPMPFEDVLTVVDSNAGWRHSPILAMIAGSWVALAVEGNFTTRSVLLPFTGWFECKLSVRLCSAILIVRI